MPNPYRDSIAAEVGMSEARRALNRSTSEARRSCSAR